MDSITHTLFGLVLYGSVNKTGMNRKQKTALLATAVIGSQIPDIDVVSSLWDTQGRYQMWHRGITHSLLLVPLWAAVLAGAVMSAFKVKGWLCFNLALLAVFIHSTSDIFNAWGTGYFEPLSTVRLTFGTIPIVDFVFWALMAGGFLTVRFGWTRRPSHKVYRMVWGLMVFYVGLQTAQGIAILHQSQSSYEQTALSADFIPGVFTVIGKTGETVTLEKGSLWTGFTTRVTLESQEDADLDALFEKNPKARTLKEWSPFVVVVDDGERLGVYDPRFYRNGQSFLFEFIAR